MIIWQIKTKHKDMLVLNKRQFISWTKSSCGQRTNLWQLQPCLKGHHNYNVNVSQSDHISAQETRLLVSLMTFFLINCESCLSSAIKASDMHGSQQHWNNETNEAKYTSLVAQTTKNLPVMQETWVGKILWRRERLATLVFWPGGFHGHRSLVGYSPQGHRVRHDWVTSTFSSLSSKLEKLQQMLIFCLNLCIDMNKSL